MTDKILIDRSVVEQALKALEKADRISGYRNNWAEVNSLIAALEQPQVEQEPVAWLWIIDGKRHSVSFGGPNSNTPKDWIVQPLYTHPQPKRQPLTDAEILMVLDAADIPDLPRDFKDVDIDIARAIEAAHGIGGEK